MNATDKLAADCRGVARLSAEAQAWIEDPENSGLVGAEARSLVAMTRKSARRARRLAQAAEARMSVSVFGPSQAGKSFLVSVLARPATGPLIADFDDPQGQLDYIREINPEGEGESTGLVTRFTVVGEPVPDGFPVRLALLGEADILRTLANSFFLDGDRSETPPEPAEIAAHLDLFKDRSGQVRPGMDADDVHETADYIEATFGREAYAAALRPFWDDAARIAPGLSLDDRAAFFAPLWGGHRAFSELFLRLAGALAQLGHPDRLFARLDALVPRDQSIIDVKTLGGAADSTPLTVTTADGRRADLPRSVVSALAAELVLPMRDLPSPMFRETDLLDFPGARNRFEQDLGKALEEPEEILPELLLRGKVAYLFDRYVEMQEITSMLLCIPDSNMETVDLPGLVQGWIAKTHGASAQERADGDCVLFMVLTKFDKHLSDSAAEGGDQSRFERRMQASLLEKFGKGSDPWVSEWTPGRPFDNCFWLRNPNYYVDGLIEYDAERREQRIRPGKEQRLTELRDGCLQASAVSRHFFDPAAAWDAALALNDGGVSFLIQQLEKACKPDRKLIQIRGQIGQLRSRLVQALAAYHVSDDVEKRKDEKRAAALRVIDDLEQTLSRHRFGSLVSGLMVDQDEIAARIARVPSSVRIANAVSAASGGEALARPGRPTRPESPEISPQIDVRTMTLEEFQAETALESWIEAMKSARDDAGWRRAHGLAETSSTDLVAELIHGARRLRLGAHTAESLRDVNFGLTVEQQAQPAAILGAETINQFVATLGASDQPEESRAQVPVADGGTRPVFAARPSRNSVADLPARPRNRAEEVWSDWAFALEALFVENAGDGLNGAANVEQNRRLGRILGTLGRRDE